MVKSADTADLKSADPNRSWGFKSPFGHHFAHACLPSIQGWWLFRWLLDIYAKRRRLLEIYLLLRSYCSTVFSEKFSGSLTLGSSFDVSSKLKQSCSIDVMRFRVPRRKYEKLLEGC